MPEQEGIGRLPSPTDQPDTQAQTQSPAARGFPPANIPEIESSKTLDRSGLAEIAARILADRQEVARKSLQAGLVPNRVAFVAMEPGSIFRSRKAIGTSLQHFASVHSP